MKAGLQGGAWGGDFCGGRVCFVVAEVEFAGEEGGGEADPEGDAEELVGS